MGQHEREAGGARENTPPLIASPIIKKEPPRRSTRCDETPTAGLLAGIAQFNAGEYWEYAEEVDVLPLQTLPPSGRYARR